MWTTGDAGSAALALSLSYPTPSSIVVPAGAAAVVLAAGAVAGVVCAVRCCGRCGSACGVWTTADAGTADPSVVGRSSDPGWTALDHTYNSDNKRWGSQRGRR